MRSKRKLEFLAFLLPVGGAVFILPPLVLIANVGTTIFGVPAIIAYLFAVWLALIVAAFALQRALAEIQETEVETVVSQPMPGAGAQK